MIPSDYVVLRSHSRAWFVVLISLVMLIAQGLFLFAASDALSGGGNLQSVVIIVATALGGLSFGAIWPHMVVMASELFGSKNLPTNYMFYDGGCGAVGTILLANLLPSAFYHTTDGNNCIGSACFRTAHLIIMVLCASGVVTGSLLSYRSSALYKIIARAVQASQDERGNWDSDSRPIIESCASEKVQSTYEAYLS